MRKSFFSSWVISDFRAAIPGVIILLFSAFIAPPSHGGETAAIDRLARLNERIDSLEVEQQNRKRNNQPLDEFDARIAQLRDSVQALRLELQQKAVPQPRAEAENQSRPADGNPPARLQQTFFSRFDLDRLKSLGLLDRILIGAGAATLLFLAFLIISFVKNRSRRARRSSQPPSLTKIQLKPPLPDPAIPREPAAEAPAVPLDATIATVRERIDAEPPLEKREVAPAPPVSPTRSMPAISPEGAVPSERIIQAANDGVDIKEIARRFKIGVDQVSLIVKMAKKR
jgi:hypothetical protein